MIISIADQHFKWISTTLKFTKITTEGGYEIIIAVDFMQL